MARDDIPIRVPLDYGTIKQLDQEAAREGVPRGTRARRLLRAGLGLQRLLSNPALVATLAELPEKPDAGAVEKVRRLLQLELTGN